MDDKVFITNNEKNNREERENDRYDLLLMGMQQNFFNLVQGVKHVFKADVPNLFDIYLKNIPEEARQYYNCNKCKLFLNRFGSMVAGDEKTGELTSLLWNIGIMNDTIMPVFLPAIKAMQEAIEKAPIKRLFLSDIGILGTPEFGGHNHFSLDIRDINSVKTRQDKTASELMEKADSDATRLQIAIDTYSTETVKRALHLLKSEFVFRSAKFTPIMEKFLEIKTAIDGTKNEKIKTNIVKLNAALVPDGVKYIKKSVLGELMDDLTEGLDLEDVKRRFNKKVDDGYQRPTEAASRNLMNECEEFLNKEGLTPSLERRFASDADIPEKVWEPEVIKASETKTGLFANLEAKDDKEKNEDINLDEIKAAKLMTFEKFQQKVLPDAKSMEIFLSPRVGYSYCVLLTAKNADAKPIFKWDKEDQRNPVSWYHTNDNNIRPYHMGLNSTNNLYKVKYIIRRPIEWFDNTCDESLKAMIFAIEACKDSRVQSLSLFPEAIISDLYKYRQVIEQYSQTNKLEESDNQVVGIALQQGECVPGYIMVKVKTDLGYAWYNIDRLE